MSPQPSPPRIAVVGGGISGLAAAHRIVELAPSCDLTLFEAGNRLGGVLETVHRDNFLIERSADMFTTKDPWALDLCRRIGIEDQLINTNEQNRRAFVVHQGRLEPVPEGFTLMSPARIWPVVKTRLLSWRGKVRLARERFIRSRNDDSDESLESFAIRRLGPEVYENLVQPFNGFGFVTPFVEKRQVLSVSFGSIKFAGRAPDESVLFRVFIGGACQAELAELPEQELFDIAQQELRDLLGARGEPQFRELVRWRKAMPQYHVGHLDRVARIESLVAQLPGFALAGNAYRGVGIPFCIHSGETAAQSLVADQQGSDRH